MSNATGEVARDDGRVGVSRARMTRIEDSMIVAARSSGELMDGELAARIRSFLARELAATDPLPRIALTPEAREALVSLLVNLAADGADLERPGESYRNMAERLLNQALEVVDA